jgi:hypothetical protein
MIVGETRTVRHTETGDAAFTFDETPTLAVTLPDGTAGSTPTVTVSPGTSATVQTLSANVAFPQGGIYKLTWSMDVGAQDPIIRKETYFAAYTDVYSAIRQLLSRTVTQLPDATLDPILARVTRQLVAQFPCVVSYNALTGTDRDFFDDALVYMVAASIRPTLSGVSTGEIQSKKQGSVEVKYATSSSSSVSANQVQDWMTAGWEQLRFVACIGYTTPLDTLGAVQVIMPTSILSPSLVTDAEEQWAIDRGLIPS